MVFKKTMLSLALGGESFLCFLPNISERKTVKPLQNLLNVTHLKLAIFGKCFIYDIIATHLIFCLFIFSFHDMPLTYQRVKTESKCGKLYIIHIARFTYVAF